MCGEPSNFILLICTVVSTCLMYFKADQYKTDFEAENKARAAILQEKNKLTEDLMYLQRRNEQLLEEVEQLREGFVPVRREDAASSTIAQEVSL